MGTNLEIFQINYEQIERSFSHEEIYSIIDSYYGTTLITSKGRAKNKLSKKNNYQILELLNSSKLKIAYNLIISEYKSPAISPDYSFDVSLSILRSIILLDILRYKGISTKDYQSISNRILKTSIKYEFYDYSLMVLRRMMTLSLAHHKIQMINKINNRILDIEQKLNTLEKSKQLFYTIVKRSNITLNKNNKHKEIADILLRLYELQNKSKSKKVRYNYLLAKLTYDYYRDDLKKHEISAKSILDFVKKHEALNNKSNLFNANTNYALSLIRNKKFQQAQDIIYQFNKIEINSYNKLVYIYIYELAEFYKSKNIKIDDKLIKAAYDDATHGQSRHIRNIYILDASNCFLNSFFLRAKRKIQSIEISTEKADDQLYYIRLLHIMTCIELMNYDEADYLIDSFRKNIERNRSYIESSSRWMAIKSIMVNLKRASYDFEKMSKCSTSKIKILSDNDNEYKWNYGSAEILPFHFWVICKLKNKKFEF